MDLHIDQNLIMRAIVRSQQSTVPVEMHPVSDYNSVPVNYFSRWLLERETMIQLNYVYHVTIVPNIVRSNQYLQSISRNTAEHNRLPISTTPSSKDAFPPFMEVHENAVRLDDIEEIWHRVRDEAPLFPYRKKTKYRRDYADLDLFSIHREAQKYNDCYQSELSMNRPSYDENKSNSLLNLPEPITLKEEQDHSEKSNQDNWVTGLTNSYFCIDNFKNSPYSRMPYTKMFQTNQQNNS